MNISELFWNFWHFIHKNRIIMGGGARFFVHPLYIQYVQLNLFSHLIIDQHSNCIIQRNESDNTIFSIFI